MKKVVIFGSSSMLAASLVPFLMKENFEVRLAGRNVGDDFRFECDDEAVIFDPRISNFKADFYINLIAETNVDLCEINQLKAYVSNCKVVEVLADKCNKKFSNPYLIHISTDQVYGGVGPHPENLTNPCNVYGRSKLMGEIYARGVGATILRTNFVGASHKIGRFSFTDWIFQSLDSGHVINGVTDVFFSPAHMDDICMALLTIMREPIPGIYNFGSKDSISKYDFIRLFLNELGKAGENLVKLKIEDLNLVAPRPKDMSLNVSSYENTFLSYCPTIFNVIQSCIREYRDNEKYQYRIFNR